MTMKMEIMTIDRQSYLNIEKPRFHAGLFCASMRLLVESYPEELGRCLIDICLLNTQRPERSSMESQFL